MLTESRCGHCGECSGFQPAESPIVGDQGECADQNISGVITTRACWTPVDALLYIGKQSQAGEIRIRPSYSCHSSIKRRVD